MKKRVLIVLSGLLVVLTALVIYSRSGSGTFASWIFRTGSKATTRRSVWVAAALRPRSFAEVQPATV